MYVILLLPTKNTFKTSFTKIFLKDRQHLVFNLIYKINTNFNISDLSYSVKYSLENDLSNDRFYQIMLSLAKINF